MLNITSLLWLLLLVFSGLNSEVFLSELVADRPQ